jgi:branched-chain amino acid transport system permease protein
MYFGYFAYAIFGVSSILAMPAAVLFLALLGWLVYKTIIARVLKSQNLLSQIVVTFGIGIFLQSAFLYLFTGDYRSVDRDPWLQGDLQIGSVFLSLADLVTSILSLSVISAVGFFIKHTNTGKAIIATSLDRETAQLMGVNTDLMNGITFSVGIACLGVGGVVLPVTTHVSPYSGFLFGVLAFTIVAMGGFGSIVGTILAGVIVGMIETFGGFFIEPAYKYLCVFVLYLLILTVRPKGIFGW